MSKIKAETSNSAKPKPVFRAAKMTELWMLWVPNLNDWATAWDDPEKYDAYLCAKSRPAIEALKIHQSHVYGIEGRPVRVI
jgi:hypothetical protein